MTIPIVDFSPFLHGTEAEKKEVASQIDSAFSNIGFVCLKNHGIPIDTIDECFQWVKSPDSFCH
jgi:isopenicillin N synthase-like dioxygenase